MNKIDELKSVIDKEVPENFSPTLRAKLVSINSNGMCTMEVVPSPYEGSWAWQQNHTSGHRYERPIEYVWNAYFF
jgi:hypothetical protein